MSFKYDTYCGLDCGACHVLGANERGDQEWIKAAAKEDGIEPEDLRCHGCKSDVNAVYCADCDIRSCAIKRGLEFCFECDEYPCKTISDFRNDESPHHSVVFKNLKEIKEKGVAAWLEDEARRWSCKTCGTRFFWYSEKCSKCGAELYNAVAEDKDLKDI